MKYYGGIDLGGTNSKIGLLNENGEMLFSTIVKTDAHLGHEQTFRNLSNVLKEKTAEHGISYDDVVAVGVGIPGPVINKSTVLFWANLDWTPNLNLAKEFEKQLGKPVFMDNDVNVITLGELWVGAAKGYKNVLGVAIGTGIGSGLVIDGQIVEGKSGAAGEIGHVPLVMNGKLCGCGRKGCLEAYASATGIERMAEDRLRVNKRNMLAEVTKGRAVEAKDVFDCAKKGDALALEVVDEATEYLAMGLGSGLNMVDSDLVVLGGGVSLAGDFLIDKVKEKLVKYLLPAVYENLEIKIAKLGNDAGIYGAGYLAMQSVK